jgi:hypothetical protein
MILACDGIWDVVTSQQVRLQALPAARRGFRACALSESL